MKTIKRFDPAEAPDLRAFVEAAFRFDTAATSALKYAMDYQFAPQRQIISSHGLSFDIILNHGRYEYVTKNLPATEPVSPGIGAGTLRRKRSLVPHRDPASEPCPFDDLEGNPLFVAELSLESVRYGLVVNKRPWGHHHVMLVTREPEPQVLSADRLAAALRLLWALGVDYEGIFTSVAAGASIYHFHLQIHKGAAAVWRNIEAESVRLEPILSSADLHAFRAVGWPAEFLVFEAADCGRLAAAVHLLITLLVEGEHDYPYNVGFRREGAVIRLLLFPRSAAGEKPEAVNSFPDSWGRFAFGEMGGSLYVLTPEGFSATVSEPAGLVQAINQMSIRPADLTVLVDDFRQRIPT